MIAGAGTICCLMPLYHGHRRFPVATREKSASVALTGAFRQHGKTGSEGEEMQDQLPAWLDRAEYPFASHWFATESGRMHWVEAGVGAPIVLVHGTPTWSFEWRHLIKGLS